MANVKLFADRQTDRQTDGQAKNYMPPIFRYGGIKRVNIERDKFLQIHALAKLCPFDFMKSKTLNNINS
jgi:hypothetical protein